MKLFTAAAAAALLSCAYVAQPSPVAAHASLERPQAEVGGAYKGVLRIPHGCAGEPTLLVRISLPDEIVGVKPMPKPGWKTQTIVGPYARPFDNHGRVEKEGARVIVWSGGALEDAHVDEFVFFARVAPEAAAKTVYLPVEQECANGRHAWTQIPAAGADARGLKSPAPRLRLVAAQGEGKPAAGHNHADHDHAHHDHAAHDHAAHDHAGAAAPAQAGGVYRLGALRIEQVWTRATPRSAPVAAGFLRIVNEGREADRLIGGAFERAGRVEVHEMAHVEGVMRMRQVSGLEIAPGARVELRPGGYHLMFLDLQGGVNAGERLKGALVFEKAGRVDVTFEAAPVGASQPGAAQTGAPAAGGHGHRGHGAH